ncbi:hypothetical protein J6590_038543 [Homalodisca vitripennis]|nr:hypothetical protein J6590_038543 [Homalodisca vitripennis]
MESEIFTTLTVRGRCQREKTSVQYSSWVLCIYVMWDFPRWGIIWVEEVVMDRLWLPANICKPHFRWPHATCPHLTTYQSLVSPPSFHSELVVFLWVFRFSL